MIEKKVCLKKKVKVKKMEISLDTTKTEWVVQLGNRLTPEKRRGEIMKLGEEEDNAHF